MSTVVLVTLFAPGIAAHELPDNRVEIGLDAVVMSTMIEISYSVAMNDTTMLKIEPSLAEANETEDGQEDLVRRFGPLALPKLGKGISVVADEENLAVKPVRWEVSARHPVRFICYYQVDLAETASSDETSLIIEDRNYRDLEKQIAVALRAKHTASIVSSDAALLLVRAKRNQVWEFDSQEQLDAQSIRAKVSIEGDRPVDEANEKGNAANTTRSQPTNGDESFVPPISLLVGLCVLAVIVIAAIFVLVRR